MRRILVIDGTNSIYQLNHQKVAHKDVLWTFINDVKRIMGERKISKAVLIYDKGESRYRLGLNPDYKGERKARRAKEAIENPTKAAADRAFRDLTYKVIEQLPLFGIETLCLPGIEADDIIAFLANCADLSTYEIDIMSTDGDLMQLIRPGVEQRGYSKTMSLKPTSVKLPDKVWVNEKRFQDAYELVPAQFTEMKALAGDRGDSVPSPEGLGPGWALKLMRKYGSLEGVKANIDNLEIPRMPAKVKESLKTQWDLVGKALELVNLRHTPETLAKIFRPREQDAVYGLMENFARDPQMDDDAVKDLMLEAGKVGLLRSYEAWAMPLQGKVFAFE